MAHIHLFDDSLSFHLTKPKICLANVKDIVKTGNLDFYVLQSATYLIRDGWHLARTSPDYGTEYRFDYSNGLCITVYQDTNTIFYGNKKDFLNFYNIKYQDDILNKIVSFVYNGGSKPGSKRIVRVKESTKDYILGLDISEIDLNRNVQNIQTAYRRYNRSNIVGKVEVLG